MALPVESVNTLSNFDFVIISFTCSVSILVGSYFGLFKKSKSASEYLDGGKDLSVIPVSISICASTISSIGFLGVATEMYEYGVHQFIGVLATVISAAIAIYFFVPVFYDLKCSSSYEYLERRFNQNVRKLTAVFFILDCVFYSSVVMYASSLALSKMSGLNLQLINIVSFGICILYTVIGGIKGVVWTDTIQSVMMVGSMVTMVVIGIYNVGGLENLWDISMKTKHLQVDFSPNPFIRTTFWTAVFGHMWYTFGLTYLNQCNIQRFNSVPTLKDAKRICVYSAIGCTFLLFLSNMCGLVVFADYHDCDPITAKIVNRAEEVLPHFVSQNAQFYPGLSGVFISGLFSASFSTVSAKLNSVSGVVYNDLLLKFFKDTNFQDSTAKIILKSLVLFFGLCCIGMGFAVDHMGQVMQLCITLFSICYGGLIGLFILGMFFPKCSAKGAISGAMTSAIFIGWICFGTQYEIASGHITYQKLPTSIAGCPNLTNGKYYDLMTSHETPKAPQENSAFLMYHLSYMYYTLFGTIITVVFGMLVSWLTGFNDPCTVEPSLLTPCLQKGHKNKFSPSPFNPREMQPLKRDSLEKDYKEYEHEDTGKMVYNSTTRP